jgi:hypothetical protein
MSKDTILRGLLIDPYQKQIHEVSTKCDINAWHKLLDCDILDVARAGDYKGQPIDIWVDDEGLLHEPQPPLFRWKNYPTTLAGYGLILSSNHEGDSISTNIDRWDLGKFIQFEDWERRLKVDEYFDQLSRIYPLTETGTYGMGGTSYDAGRRS